MRITIVFNPVSGRGNAKRTAGELAEALARAGHDVQRVPSQPGGVHGGNDWITPALDNAEALLVVGGDGTVRDVATSTARAGVPLLPVPMGTENLLARGFGMRRDTASVLNTLEHGSRVPIDMALANGEPMLLMASAGLDAAVVADVSESRGASISMRTYLHALRRCLRTFRTPAIHVEVDGRQVVDNIRGWVVVANAPDYGARLDPSPRSKIDDGLLDVVFLPCRTRVGFAAWVALSRMGVHLKHRNAVAAKGRSITIGFDEPTPVQFDGDRPNGDCRVESLHVELAPERLTVIVPPRAVTCRSLLQSPVQSQDQSPAEAST